MSHAIHEINSLLEMITDHNAPPKELSKDDLSWLLLVPNISSSATQCPIVSQSKPSIADDTNIDLLVFDGPNDPSKEQFITPLTSTTTAASEKVDDFIATYFCEHPLERTVKPSSIDTIEVSFEDTSPLDPNLFAHVHGDSFIAGTNLEGASFVDTITLMTRLVKTFKKSFPKRERILVELEDATNNLVTIQNQDYTTLRNNTLGKKYSLIPFGWRDSMHMGHAMLCEITIDEVGNAIVSIFNTGAGLVYHDSTIMDHKAYSSFCKRYSIPKDSVEFILNEDFFRVLIEYKTSPQDFTEKDIYSFLQSAFDARGILAVDIFKKKTPQRSGICAWKTLMAWLNITMDDEKQYLNFKLTIKMNSLKNLYKALCRQNPSDISSDAVRLLRLAAEKTSREIEKYAPENRVQLQEEIRHILDFTKSLDIKKPITTTREKACIPTPTPMLSFNDEITEKTETSSIFLLIDCLSFKFYERMLKEIYEIISQASPSDQGRLIFLVFKKLFIMQKRLEPLANVDETLEIIYKLLQLELTATRYDRDRRTHWLISQYVLCLMDKWLKEQVKEAQDFSVIDILKPKKLLIDPAQEKCFWDTFVNSKSTGIFTSTYTSWHIPHSLITFLARFTKDKTKHNFQLLLNTLDPKNPNGLPVIVVWIRKIIHTYVFGLSEDTQWKYDHTTEGFMIASVKDNSDPYPEFASTLFSNYKENQKSNDPNDLEKLIGRYHQGYANTEHYRCLWQLPKEARVALYFPNATNRATNAIGYYMNNISLLRNARDREELFFALFSSQKEHNLCSNLGVALMQYQPYQNTLQRFIDVGLLESSQDLQMTLFFLRLGALFHRYTKVFCSNSILPNYRKELRQFLSEDKDICIRATAATYLLESYSDDVASLLSSEDLLEIIRSRAIIAQTDLPKDDFFNNIMIDEVMNRFADAIDILLTENPNLLTKIFHIDGWIPFSKPCQYQSGDYIFNFFTGELLENGQKKHSLPQNIVNDTFYGPIIQIIGVNDWQVEIIKGGTRYTKGCFTIIDADELSIYRRDDQGHLLQYVQSEYVFWPICLSNFHWWSNGKEMFAIDDKTKKVVCSIKCNSTGNVTLYKGETNVHLDDNWGLQHFLPEEYCLVWKIDDIDLFLEIPSMHLDFTRKNDHWISSQYPGFYIAENQKVKLVKHYSHALLLTSDSGQQKVIFPFSPFRQTNDIPSLAERTPYMPPEKESTEPPYIDIDIDIDVEKTDHNLIETTNPLHNLFLAYHCFIERDFAAALYHLDKCRTTIAPSQSEKELYRRFANSSNSRYDNTPDALCVRLHFTKLLLENGYNPDIDFTFKILADYNWYLNNLTNITIRQLSLAEERFILRKLQFHYRSYTPLLLKRAVDLGVISEEKTKTVIQEPIPKQLISDFQHSLRFWGYKPKMDDEWLSLSIVDVKNVELLFYYDRFKDILCSSDEEKKKKVLFRLNLLAHNPNTDPVLQKMTHLLLQKYYYLQLGKVEYKFQPIEMLLPSIHSLPSFEIKVMPPCQKDDYFEFHEDTKERVRLNGSSKLTMEMNQSIEAYERQFHGKWQLTVPLHVLREHVKEEIEQLQVVKEMKQNILKKLHTCSVDDLGKRNSKKLRFPKFDELIHLYIARDINGLLKKTTLTKQTAEEIFQDVENYLLKMTKLQKMKRTLALIEQGNTTTNPVILEKIATSWLADRSYQLEAKTRALLAFEYFNNLLIRSDQIEVLNQFLTKKQICIQAIMGMGKSKIILPLLMYMMRVEGKIPAAIVPKALYEPSISDMYSRSLTSFGQKLTTFKVNRYTSDSDLTTYYDKLVEAINDGGYLLFEEGTIHALFASYEEALLNGDTERLDILQKILVIFKDRVDVIADEIDELLKSRKEENFTVGLKEVPSSAMRRGIEFVYYHIGEKLDKELLADICAKEFKVSKDYLLGKSFDLPDIAEETKQIVATIRALFTLYLDFTFNKNPKFQYGLSKRNKEQLFAIPYDGVDQPVEGAHHGEVIETLCYTWQYYFRVGLTEEQLKTFLKEEKSKIILEAKNSTKSIQELERYQQLEKIFGKDFFDKDDEFFRKFLHNKDLIRSFCNQMVIPQITFYKKKITSNGQNFVEMFNSFGGFTGTLWNRQCYHSSIKFPISVNVVDGRTLHLLLTRNPLVHTVENVTIEKVLDKVIERGCKVLIDGGGLFWSKSNLEVAYILSKGPFKNVLFFNENNELMVLQNGLIKPFKDSKLDMDECFTYYDQRHCRGIDIAQPLSAKALVTVGEHMMLEGLLQSIKRMRELELGQSIEFVAVKGLLQEESVNGILALTIKLQEKVLAEEVLKAARQAVQNSKIKVTIEQSLRGEKKQDTSFFVQEMVEDPVLQYGGALAIRSMDDIFKDQLSSDDELSRYIRERTPFMPEHVLDYTLDTQCQVKEEIEAQKEVEKQNEIQEGRWFTRALNSRGPTVNFTLQQLDKIKGDVFSSFLFTSQNVMSHLKDGPHPFTWHHSPVNNVGIVLDPQSGRLKEVRLLDESEASKIGDLDTEWFIYNVNTYSVVRSQRQNCPLVIHQEDQKEFKKILMQVKLLNAIALGKRSAFDAVEMEIFQEWKTHEGVEFVAQIF